MPPAACARCCGGRATRGAHLHIDMESVDALRDDADLVLDLLAEPEFRAGPSAGVVLQAYLRDSPAHARRAARVGAANRARARR